MKFGSLFSGIGGFDLGFEQAELECAWQVEIDKDCNKALAKHWPNVKRYSDVKEVGGLQSVDVICGGFPCQDLSVAGKREGLAGERSGLWFEFLRIIKSNLPRFVVIENVPGLLSSNGGRDFAVILRGLVECGYSVAWRILDAQYDGVAQRRRRVFIVGSFGNGSCAEILFESEGVSWNPPTRGEARAGVAPTVRGGTASGSNEFGNKVASYKKRGGFGWSEADDVTATLESEGGTHQGGPERVPLVTHALSSEGADASEDGTGRGTPIIAATLNSGGNSGGFRSEPGEHLVAFSSKDSGADAGEIAPTLRSMNFDESHINGGGQVAIAFGWNKSDSQTMRVDEETTDALQALSTSNPAVAIAAALKQRGRGATDEVMDNLQIAFHENKSGQLSEADVLGLRSGASHNYQGIGGNFGVRRLTPRECERLQGFPDDWTRYDSEGKEISDSARYRMLGNAVAVPCAEWLGKRIAKMSGL